MEKEENKNEKKFLRDKYATKLLRDKECRDYLLAIVSRALGLKLDDVKEGFELEEIRIGLTPDTKDQESDVIAFNVNNYFNIEINYNMSRETDYKNMCYICNLILRQIKPGTNNRYKNILPVTQINLSNYDQFKKGQFIYVSKVMEENLKIVRSDLMTIVDINLDFLSDICYTDIRKYKKDSLEYLLYAFVCADEKKREELYMGDKVMNKVNEKLNTMDTNIDAYLYYDKEALVHEASREQGFNEGMEQGIQKGKEEIIRTMLIENYSLEDISKITKVSIEKIKEISSEI